MKKITIDAIIDEIHRANHVPKATLRSLPLCTIIDIFHNLFGTNGVQPQNYYVQ